MDSVNGIVSVYLHLSDLRPWYIASEYMSLTYTDQLPVLLLGIATGYDIVM